MAAKRRRSNRRILVTYLAVLAIIQAVGLISLYIFRGFFRRNPLLILLVGFLLGTALPIILGLIFHRWIRSLR
ncbi:hypothetical protein DRO24_05300 [Candidatus Bathyarchaeota archaeon]|nr:MAG: hypothetical protein DRO24_05300 [Candidatus Bathyarchaeota archaeon]